jgi:chaperonin GroEL
LLASSIFIEASKLISAGHPPQALIQGIRTAAEAASDVILRFSTPLESDDQLKGIARSAARGHYHEALGAAEAVKIAGKDGYVELHLGSTSSIRIERSQGFEIPGSVVGSHGLVLAEETETNQISDVGIVFIGKQVEAGPSAERLQNLIRTSGTPLVICARGFAAQETVTEILLSTAKERGLPLILVETHYSSSDWGDAPSYAGTYVIREIPDKFDSQSLGHVSTITVAPSAIRAYGANTDSPTYRSKVHHLKKAIDSKTLEATIPADLTEWTNDKGYQMRNGDDEDRLRKRLAHLVGKHVRLVLPGQGSTQAEEAADCIRNALRSIRVAEKSGIVAGGGEVYLRAADGIASIDCPDPQRFGVSVVRRALVQPLFWIASNTGKEPTSVVEKVAKLQEGFGYDAENDQYVRLKDVGILDACGLCMAALQNAVSTACFMLSVSTIVGTVTGEEDISEHDLRHMIERRLPKRHHLA